MLSVRCTNDSTKPVTRYNTLKTLTLRCSNNIDIAACLENIRGDFLTDFVLTRFGGRWPDSAAITFSAAIVDMRVRVATDALAI